MLVEGKDWFDDRLTRGAGALTSHTPATSVRKQSNP